MAIGIRLGAGMDTPPMGSSFLWGMPQMPEFLEYPFCKSPGYEPYPFFFLGQVSCAEAAPLDESGMLPKKGYLWFFADLDYFMGYTDETVRTPGRWDRKAVQVLYSHVSCEELSHEFLTFPAETEMMPPQARPMTFQSVPDDAPGPRLLGAPMDPDAAASFGPDWVALLQIVHDDDFDGAGFGFFVERASLEERKFRRSEGFLSGQ